MDSAVPALGGQDLLDRLEGVGAQNCVGGKLAGTISGAAKLLASRSTAGTKRSSRAIKLLPRRGGWRRRFVVRDELLKMSQDMTFSGLRG